LVKKGDQESSLIPSNFSMISKNKKE
jgi:hypothetical protein